MRKKGEFRNVFERGIKVSSKFLVLYALPNELGHNRVGLSVSRKVGSAVVRNRTKRRLRESLRRNMPDVISGCDFVIVARKSSADADYNDLNAAVMTCISGVVHEKTVYTSD